MTNINNLKRLRSRKWKKNKLPWSKKCNNNSNWRKNYFKRKIIFKLKIRTNLTSRKWKVWRKKRPNLSTKWNKKKIRTGKTLRWKPSSYCRVKKRSLSTSTRKRHPKKSRSSNNNSKSKTRSSSKRLSQRPIRLSPRKRRSRRNSSIRSLRKKRKSWSIALR